MLTRPTARRGAAALALAVVGWSAAAAAPARAAGSGSGTGGGGTVTSCANDWVCTVASSPGSGGSGTSGSGGGSGAGSGGSSNACLYHGKQEPCYIGGVGYLDSGDGCYYQLAQPQPPAGDISWGGHQPGDGAVYTRACPDLGGTGQTDVWRAQPPNAQPAVTPEQLAHEMVARLHLPAPSVRTAPAGRALVGEPIWLWAGGAGTAFPDAAHPLTVPDATAGGVTVHARVWAARVVWDMGDGGTAPCDGPGTPYRPQDGAAASPDCGYTYRAPSTGRPGGEYRITATTHWTVRWWVNGGAPHTFDTAPTTGPAGALRVTELQVLN